MGTATKIEWCDHTASPWHGCTKIAAGCDNCYAAAGAVRNPGTLGIWGDEGTRIKSKSFIKNLEGWNRQAAKEGRVVSVFPSICDPFEDRPELAPWREEMFAAIDRLPQVRMLLLTKRPENIWRLWPLTRHGAQQMHSGMTENYRPNVWLITSIATQADADRNIPLLLKVRDLSPVLGLSCEPLLGPIRLTTECDIPADEEGPLRIGYMVGPDDKKSGLSVTRAKALAKSGISWIIVGGESGHGARPMHPDWARSLRDQCVAAGVSFFFKQWGEWCLGTDSDEQRLAMLRDHQTITLNHNGATSCLEYAPPVETMFCLGKKAAGRLLDGREWNEFPTETKR